VEYDHPDLGSAYGPVAYSPKTFTAGPGPDTTVLIEGVTNLAVDLSATGLTVRFGTTLDHPTWNATPFNGLVLTDNTAPHQIYGATVENDTTLAGFDASRIAWTGDQIRLNFSGLSYVDGSLVSIGLAVPEPASLALFGAGLAGAAMLRRRRTLEAAV